MSDPTVKKKGKGKGEADEGPAVTIRKASPISFMDGAPALGVSWVLTDTAPVLTASVAQAHVEDHTVPDVAERIAVWGTPPGAPPWILEVLVDTEAESEPQRFEFFEDAPRLNKEKRLDAQFVCVHGPGSAKLAFPGLNVVDVSDGEGHAPSMQVQWLGGEPVPVKLGGEAGPVAQGTVRVRLTGMMFETSKAFMLPSALESIRRLKFIYDEHPGAEVLVVGHADTAGSATYNLPLSEERAGSIAAYLQDDVDHWLGFYSNPSAEKKWGVREDQLMLSALQAETGKARLDEGDPPAFYSGSPNGNAYDPGTRQAVTDFQNWSNANRGTSLVVDGLLGPNTRRPLVAQYMDQDDTRLPEGTVLETHGCGEFHPAVQTGDGVSEEENRRVEVFVFDEDGIAPPPQSTCPAPGCPEYPQWVERAKQTIDLREDMPEVTGVEWEVGEAVVEEDAVAAEPEPTEPLALTVRDQRGLVCPDCAVVVTTAAGFRTFGTSDASGALLVEVPASATQAFVRFTPPGSASLVQVAVELDLPPVSDDAGALARLRNLGYPVDGSQEDAITQFQFHEELEETGALDGATRQRLGQVHDGLSE